MICPIKSFDGLRCQLAAGHEGAHHHALIDRYHVWLDNPLTALTVTHGTSVCVRCGVELCNHYSVGNNRRTCSVSELPA